MERLVGRRMWAASVALIPIIAGAQSELPTARHADSDIEADWLLQLKARQPMTTKDDALGAVDGVKDGGWAFHTGSEENPWWHVDLGAMHAIDRVVIYNRADGAAGRTAHFILLTSGDGKEWQEAYRHDGTVFYGATDGKPLVVPLKGLEARFVRMQVPGRAYLHLDEVEVYAVGDPEKNIALWKLADQISLSQWSSKQTPPGAGRLTYPLAQVIERGRRLAADLREAGVDVEALERELAQTATRVAALAPEAPDEELQRLYFEARWAIRRLALTNPLLDFDRILFAKRVPASYSHMSDQYYGWWSRPGGGIYVLRDFRGETPTLRCLTEGVAEGSFLRPDLSYDGERVLFAYCRYYPESRGLQDKVTKENLPEDAFYHVFEMNVDGTGLRQLTQGRYDDFDARYLPNGEIVFLSTRRGQAIQCGKASATATTLGALPDSYVRCGGGRSRPVAVYTLHVMDADGGDMRAVSPFESFEWTPAVAHDGRILYARWDYVDRSNMPYMSLWSINSDGTNAKRVYGNFTTSPHCIFEARPVPNSHKLIFTASAHHAITGGSLVLLDPRREFEGHESLTRLTPEVRFPEVEGWPPTYYSSPYPLSESYYLVAWSSLPIRSEGGANPPNGRGLYLCDAFGNLELIYRDPEISCMYPIPLRPRPLPQARASSVAWDETREGRFLLLDVYKGLAGVERGGVKRLRIVGVPAKTQPEMNTPPIGVTRDDPGKCVLGTVPVEADGSAHFRVPAGVAVFFQALDGDGMAVQTMRTLTHVQPGQTLSCVGCHEHRSQSPQNALPLAARRTASKIALGPEGSWPLRFDQLVQPVMDKHCVSCHRPDSGDEAAAKLDLTAAHAYDSLIAYGKPSLRDHVLARYREGRSLAGACAARTSALLALLEEGEGHHDVRLDADDLERLVTWMDTYAQRQGSFSDDQEDRLRELRADMAALLEE